MVLPRMKALVTVGDGTFRLQDISVPALASGQILVKVVAVAQNPTDWKTLLLHTRAGNILGSDFAGTVIKLGTDVPADVRELGERVAGFVHGGISPNGAFAEYVAVDSALVIAIPDTMTFEHAAQLGIACFTVCQSLYQCLRLPTPLHPSTSSEPVDILIWSGTSATGQYAVQFAKLAGLRVISTASPKRLDLVRSLGADEVYDYADSKTARRISAAGGRSVEIRHGLYQRGDDAKSGEHVAGEGGRHHRDPPSVRKLPERCDIEFPFPFPRNLEHYENAKTYAKLISRVLSLGTVKPVPVRLYPHGLASVQEGLEDMKDGKIHAEKITYRIADTPGLG
ncbi:GroES-like protein [Mycena venus]|uniref:GroES-like protein n=1 Tax=Mycena venus TaxID=2733690 RepID=A0A8H6YQ72_9AGAR|nr:GroES-like protein [Mycena venus]